MYWNGRTSSSADHGCGQQVERQHVARDEEVQGHHDIQERRHFEKPETHHADAGLEEEADQERQDQRDGEGGQRQRVGKAVEEAAADEEQQGIGKNDVMM